MMTQTSHSLSSKVLKPMLYGWLWLKIFVRIMMHRALMIYMFNTAHRRNGDGGFLLNKTETQQNVSK